MRKPHENYPFDHWWVIATTEELAPGALLPRKVLGFDVVLFRREDGGIAAITDRCSHRGLPLSLGTLTGDRVICGYHGFQFDSRGELVSVPTQSRCPSAGSVRAFPAIERKPFVWIWTGNPSLARESDVPTYPWLQESGWVWALGHIPVAANYMLLKENVLDLTHFPFAHRSTVGESDSYVDFSPTPVRDTDIVGYRNEFLNQPLAPFYDEPLGLGDRLTDRVDEGVSLSPAAHVSTVKITVKEPRPGEKPNHSFIFQHMTTPATPSSHHYWWVIARDHGLQDKAKEYFREIAATTLREDVVILESIQRRNDEISSGGELQEVSVVADHAGLKARRQLQELLDAEDSRYASR
jgi:phenylpropionate dioxygenase-like ring-hydroxylating dioxygenase large terminal subunit